MNISEYLKLDSSQAKQRNINMQYLSTNYFFTAFNVEFTYASTKGKGARRHTEMAFFIPNNKVRNFDFDFQMYFDEWVKTSSKYTKPKDLKYQQLGSFELDLSKELTNKNLLQSLIEQNEDHIHFETLSKMHPKQIVFSFSKDLHVHKVNYQYETQRGNYTEDFLLILSDDKINIDQLVLDAILRVSYINATYRMPVNAKILTGDYLGEMNISA